jgi:hypothetical protein
MVTFVVDEVSPASEALPTRPLRERFPEALTIGGDPATPIVDHGAVHPLLGAVGLAFAQHRPLVLSPDAVWLTIAQGVAQHVRLNAEALRPRLVRHDGRAPHVVTRDGPMPEDAASWTAVVAALRGELAVQIGGGRARLFECDFSTSTDVERVASQVVLLDAYAPYFSYWFTCACGIPEITLTGTPADWRRIRERVDVIAELGLERWCRSLVPIADQFVRAAAGDADVAFWRRIYNPIDAYGGEVITGWITRLYPYLVSGGVMGAPNSMLDLPIDEPRGITAWRTSPLYPLYSGPGLRSDDVPDTRARVTVRVVDRVGGALGAVALEAGLVAVAQDADGALRPIAGWHLERATAHISEVLDRIARYHRTIPVSDSPVAEDRDPFTSGGPAEVVAIFRRFEAVTLFEGERAWKIRPPLDHDVVGLEDADARSLYISRVIDLEDGRSICYALKERTGALHWLVCRLREPAPSPSGEREVWPPVIAVEPPSDIPLLGTSLVAILDAALETSGEIGHLETGRLAQLLVRDEDGGDEDSGA